MSSSVAPSGNICFNSNCKEFVERTRKGWRRRTGEFADLCDRCGSAYDDGKFCEVFHLNSSGWRSCESCGKQIHCGCIVSFHTFVLLDAGGIECIACARKSFILTPNPAWPPPSLFVPLQPERIKDVNNWNPIAGSGPVPWRQAPSLFNGSIIQNELQHKAPFPEATGSIDRLSLSEKPFALLSDNNWKDSCEKLMNGKLKIGVPGTPENGYAGHNREEAPKSCISGPWQSSYANSDLSAPSFCLTVGSACKNEPTDHSKVPVSVPQQTTLPIPLPLGKQLGGHATVDSAGETHVRNSKTRGDGRGKHHLLPRYWPRITDQELQRLSEDSNSVITPLFEKMLSASDAGRIGRLVLPKKCAEAYFPPISNPEGLPLKMQDLKGKEWLFQFRFWPNNNSRMYVLEGVTPCIQSMQLQAGDIVTFSRIEPEGKLVMGCRKASTILTADQGSESYSNGKGNGIATNGNISAKSTKFSEEVPVNSTKKGFSSTTHVAATSARAETKMSDDLVKESLGNNLSIRSKRKGSTMGSKRKRLRIDNDDLVELKVTVVQAQGLMRPPSSGAPTVIVIEDCEFEEYEQDDAPIIGRPTIPHMDHLGEKIQWVQCEDCFKWRKVSDSVDLPSRWTCSDNSSDPERSVCSAVQELTADHLRDLLPHINKASKKRKTSKQEMDLVEALDGLDALAHLAILEQGETLPASPQATTKHPRHRPGCTCIVCIQPPSGKGPKHKQSCDCNVCKSVKRRFKTLMLKREKKLSEKEAEATCQKLQPQLAGQLLDADDIQESIDDAAHFSPQHGELNNEGSVHDPNYLNEKKPIVDDPNNEKKSSVDDPNFLNEKKSSADDPNHLNEKKSSVDDPNYLNEKKSSVDDPSYLNEKNSSVDDPNYLNEKKSSVDDPDYLNEKKSSVDDPDYLNEKKSSVDDPGYLDEKKSNVNDPNYLNEKKSSVDDPGYFDEKTSYVDDPNYLNEKKSSASPFKGEIDLNAKPERDDELSPGSDSGSMIRILKDAAEQYVRRHCGNGSSVSNQKTGDGAGETNPSTCVIVSGSHQTDVDHNRPLPVGTAASLAPNGQ